ncbi:hypothetical protein IWW48_002078 [Coemansia sp. RSA 1200]|nr:hypothetical protein IWW48_002078 [Coemansia sp. RSA 1200]
MVEIKAKAILFDMDGTLVNTVKCVEKWWRILAKQHNVDIDSMVHDIHGRPTYDLLCSWFPEPMHTREQAQECERLIMMDTDGVHIVPGADKLLAALNRDQWAIVTGATEELARTRLAQVGLAEPEHLVASHSIANGKPAPDCYQLGARLLDVRPAETVVFEDSVNGVKAGVQAGALVVAILSSTSESLLRDAGASYAVRDFGAVGVTNRDGILTLSIDE